MMYLSNFARTEGSKDKEPRKKRLNFPKKLILGDTIKGVVAGGLLTSPFGLIPAIQKTKGDREVYQQVKNPVMEVINKDGQVYKEYNPLKKIIQNKIRKKALLEIGKKSLIGAGVLGGLKLGSSLILANSEKTRNNYAKSIKSDFIKNIKKPTQEIYKDAIKTRKRFDKLRKYGDYTLED